MNKKNIAIVFGGYSSEDVVSGKSAEGLLGFIDEARYNRYLLLLNREKWVVLLNNKEYEVNKNDFSFTIENIHIKFDFAYITIHGTPGEDGILQGYLRLLNIPHSTCNVLSSSLTFNKYMCNQYLKNFGIKTARSVLIKKGSSYNLAEIGETIGFPCFVKPNAGGSSFGISKVKYFKDLEGAISKAYLEHDEVMIEQFIDGIEVTCGLYKTLNKSVVFPLTEVISKNEFFDYEAKYTPEKVTEITPARINNDLATAIQNTSSRIYDLLGCKGIIRIDYIIQSDEYYILEVNTTPGMTTTSFIPQQVNAMNLNIKEVFSEVIEDAFNRSDH